MEETLYDSESMRRFAGIELGQDEVPDETTILKFRHLLERHELTKKLFAQVQRASGAQEAVVALGHDCGRHHYQRRPARPRTPPGKHDPEMSSTRKGTDWFFGMKLHVGTDTVHGLAHTRGGDHRQSA